MIKNPSEKPLKVVYVEAPSARFGSTLSLLSLVSALDRKRIQPFVVINSDNPGAEDFRRLAVPVFEIRIPGNVEFFGGARKSLMTPRSETGLLSLFFAILKYIRDLVILRHQTNAMQKIIDHVRPDVLHLNNQPSTNRFAYYCRLDGLRIIQHVRTAPLTPSRLISFLCRRVDLFVCISQFVRSSVVDDLRINRPIQVVYNPISPEFFKVQLHDTSTLAVSQFVFLQIGRIIPHKGQRGLIEAVSILQARGWSSQRLQVKLLGVIEHRSQYEVELREMVKSLGLIEFISFCDYSNDVIAELSRAHALVHMTSEAEGFGRVVAEAMAAGLPVIVSGIGALPELVSGGQFGLIANDPEELADSMERLLLNSEEYAYLSKAAKMRADAFHVNRHSDSITECYEHLFL